MASTRFAQARRVVLRVAATLIVVLAIALAAFLPFAGRYLVSETALERADVIYVLAGSRVERWLEAVDLYREGFAPRIVLSPGIVDDLEEELRSKGVRFPSEAELVRSAMTQMGVPDGAIVTLSGTLDNTAQEASAVRTVPGAATWQRIIVVTSKYHTRRTRFAFEREFRGTPTRLMIKATRYDDSTPARWWRDRSEFRFVIWELQKLAAYRLGAAE